METYRITLRERTPLLMHADNIEWADQMKAWELNPENRGKSIAGDDRTPPFRWVGCLYHDDKFVALPTDNLMASLREAGAMVKADARRTFKGQTQSGIAPGEPSLTLTVGGKQVPMEPFFERMESRDFPGQQRLAAGYGFSLFVKRVRIGSSKHIRVRPVFSGWQCSGTLLVMDDAITEDVLQTILNYAGRYKGLGDWRPGSRTPGTFGMFEAEVERL